MLMDRYEGARTRGGLHPARNKYTSLFVTTGAFVGESGDYATVHDLAKAENINESYLGRVLRLTLLAPKIVEAILKGKQPASLDLEWCFSKSFLSNGPSSSRR